MNNVIVSRPNKFGTQEHPGMSDWAMDLVEQFLDIIHYEGPGTAQSILENGRV